MGKQRVQFRRVNWDIEKTKDIMNGTGFLITEPAVITVDEEKVKTKYGPRSYLYGDIYGNEQEAIEMRYRCDCGKTKSKQYEGNICPYCNSKVEKRKTDIKMTGWISLGRYKVINPYYYTALQSLFEKNALEDIINPKKKVDKDGNIHTPTENDLNIKPSSPYYGVGMEEFYEKFDEIMDYFSNKKKKKKPEFDQIKKEKRRVFTSSIPIYSTMLRPQSMTSDSFYYGGIDKQINPLFTLSESLRTSFEIDRPLILYRCQKRINAMFNENLEMLIGKVNGKGKDGFIRKSMLGGQLNYTARNVIIPDYTLKVNQIDISYQTARTLFRYGIISYLVNVYDLPYAKASEKWEKSVHFDQDIYDIICCIVKEEKPYILINRNPSLHYYSMLEMSIRKVKKNPNDMTLSLPLAILPGLNADFDGDILNMIALLTDELKYIFRKFNPIERMIISRSTGQLNDYFAIDKGTINILYDFANIDDKYKINTKKDAVA